MLTIPSPDQDADPLVPPHAALTFRNTLVENKIIEFTDPHAIQTWRSESTMVFNNVAPNGARSSLYDIESGYDISVDERIAADIEEAVVCSML
jgi:hypothetical protein